MDAIRLGALTELEKPVALDVLEAELRGAFERRPAAEEAFAAASAAGIVGRSPAMRALVDALMLAAPSETAVLVEGQRERARSWWRPPSTSFRGGPRDRSWP